MRRSPGLRWLLGTFEAGLFPGVNYYLSWCVAITIDSLDSTLPQLVQTLGIRHPFSSFLLGGLNIGCIRRSVGCMWNPWLPVNFS